MLSLSEIEKLPLHKLVYRILKESILNGSLKPGDKLVEEIISRKLSISKTPVREAIRELTQEGLIIHHSRRGITIIDFTEKDILEIITLREHIESFGLSLSIPRFNDEDKKYFQSIINDIYEFEQKKQYKDLVRKDLEFHKALIEASGHSRLIKIWSLLESQVLVLLNMIDYDMFALHYSGTSHTELLTCIFSGNTHVALSNLRDHIRTSGKHVLRCIKQGSNTGQL